MNHVDDWIQQITQSPTLAGVFGAILSLRWVPGPTWIARLFCFGCGIACAIYGAPALVDYLQIKSDWAPRLFNFLSGLLGMNLLAKAVDIVKTTDWINIVTSIKGKQ